MSRIQDLLGKGKNKDKNAGKSGGAGNDAGGSTQNSQQTINANTQNISERKDGDSDNSSTAKTVPSVSQSQPKSSLLQKLGKKPAGEVKNGDVSPAISNSISGPNSAGKSESETRPVVQQAQQQSIEQKSEPEKIAEKSPQAKPLSLMQRRLLESKKNVDPRPKQNIQNTQQISTGSTVQNSSGEKPNGASTVMPDVVPELSASQSADSQKQNDGAANVEELKNNLAYLANNIENKDLVAQVVRTIALQIKNNTALQPHMSNADVNLMVRGLRMAYQVAAMNKQAKADGKKIREKKVSEVDTIFKDAGLDFDFKF